GARDLLPARGGLRLRGADDRGRRAVRTVGLRARAADSAPRHRPRSRRLRAPRTAASGRRARLRPDGGQPPRTETAARRLGLWISARPRDRDRGGDRPRRRSLEWRRAGFSRPPRSPTVDRRAQAGRHSARRPRGLTEALGRPARRPRSELSQPARHAARTRAQGLPARGPARRRAGRGRRHPRALRSPGDGDARRLRSERAGRDARLAFREQTHGKRPLGGDRRTCRPHPPRRDAVAGRSDRTDAPFARARRAREAAVASRPPKYVFVTGGVVSSLGKGITAASLGRLLKARGLKVQVQKFDPYINVDPGTMSPFQHGEVFVTEDGAEIGGTVGDIESLPFLEAMRQFRREAGAENICYVHVTLVPFVDSAGELKTKPTQHSVNELRRIGIHPDIVVARSRGPLSADIREKIALFADIDTRAV